MFPGTPRLRRIYLVRITILLTVFTGLFAAGPFTLDNSIFTAASPFAACTTPCFENFDNVTAPALPSGWTTDTFGNPAWTAVNNVSDTAPNSAFAGAPSQVSDNRLISRTVAIGSSTSVLTFRRRNNLENGFDGMVLEISINGQNFQDIIAAGGSFVTGGYTGTIDTVFGSPIAGRAAWTGNTGGFITTSVNLPASANQRNVKFRWRVGTDNSVGTQGAFIDSINLTGIAQPPANDNLANAEPLHLGPSGVISGTIFGATKEDGEANHAGNSGGTSVWYRWQAPETGRFVFTTFNSGFNTLLAVYTGNNFPLAGVVSNDNEVHPVGSPCSGITTSTVSVDAIAGVIYRIAIDRHSSDQTGSNNITLRWGRSASISGRISTASGGNIGDNLSPIQLLGDACRDNETLRPSFRYTDVPTGGSYRVDFRTLESGPAFVPWDPSKSISPLTGNVSDYNFYKVQPAANIVVNITMPGNDMSGLTVRCVSTPIPLVSREGFFSGFSFGDAKYQCTGLPADANYVVTPAKPGFNFTPTNLAVRIPLGESQSVFGGFFTGTAIPFQLVLDDSGQVAALDSSLLMRDPFAVVNNSNLLNRGVDRNTRVTIFLSNFAVIAGESPSSVVVNLVGSNNQTYDIPAEDVRPATNPTFAQVTFRLPDTLTVGNCTLVVKARGLTSNLGSMRVKN